MIKSITVTNHLGDSIKLELAKPELSGFAITSISGIGPGKANVNMTELSTIDGGLYNSARVPVRNIVISLRYLWKNSIEEARHLSYKYFPLKKKVKLSFETDLRTADVEGYVESNEPNIFSNEENTDISIICPDPYFYSSKINTTVFSGIEPMFEFPFSNESVVLPLLEMGVIQNYKEKVVIYDGDAETGVVITIHARDEASNIAIYNIGTRETMRINIEVVAGDAITINTNPRSKSITLQRDGVTTNILNNMTRDSDWFKLTKGDNVFTYTAETGANNLNFTVENRILYEGV